MNASRTTSPETCVAASSQGAAPATQTIHRRTDANARPARAPTNRTTFVAPPPLWGLGFVGRINRMQWLAGVLMLVAALAIVQVVSLKHPDPAWVHGRRFALGIAAVLLLRLSALRLHDRARSGWWSLALLVPGLNVVALFELALLRGVDDITPHGHPPNGSSLIEMALAIVVLGLFVGLGVLSFHPTHAIDALRPAHELAALQPYGSSTAKAAFENGYRNAPHPKAYAASGRGAYGWAASPMSTNEAAVLALQTCESRRRWTDPACALLDVNDAALGERDAGVGRHPAR